MRLNNNKQISVWLMLVFMFAGAGAWAQGSLKGKVTDKDGNPLVGASVVVAQASLGVMTGDDGSYLLKNIPAGVQTVDFFYLGYVKQSQTVTIADGQTTTQDVMMEEEALSTDEVVVVGYGVQRRREVVGNIQKLNGDDIKPQLGSSFETGLQGKATGVQVVQGSGAIGSASTIRVRGTGSVSAAGDPLYVVDGIPIIQNYNNNQGLGSDVQNNPLQFINPNDIESVEVLKDASAIAIYGSRGANGVVIITTKRGKLGKPQFNFTANVGAGSPTVLPEMLNATEWLQIQQEAWENDGNAGQVPLPILSGQQLTLSDIAGINTNWYDQVIRTGSKQDYTASVKYGNKMVQLYSGLTYSNNQGFLVNNGMNRLTARANVDITPFKGFKASINASLARTVTDKVNQQYNGALGWAMSTALPIYPVTFDPLIANAEAEGDTAKANAWREAALLNDNYTNFGSNSAQELAKHLWKSRETRPIVNANITYSPIDKLHFTATYNLEFMDLWDFQWRDSTYNGDRLNGARSFKSEAWNTNYLNQSAYATATYEFKMPENHSLRAMIGGEGQRGYSTTLTKRYVGDFPESQPFLDSYDDLLIRDSLAFTEAPFDTLRYNSLEGYTFNNGKYAGGRHNIPVFNDESLFLSGFARINYSWKNKLLVQLTYRRDGSSKFGPNNRFGNFPSIGLGYILTEEEFLKNSAILNYLKLKTSWGITGNAGIDWRQQYALYNVFGVQNYTDIYGQNANGTRYQRKTENPDLRWETMNGFDIGFDYGLFKDRISGDFSFYFKKTTGAAINTRLQASTGFDQLEFYQNVGIVDNWGVEYSLKTRNIQRKNFSWKTEFNISHNNNIVRSNGGIPPDALDGGYGDMRVIEGYPVSTSYIVKFVRINEATGLPIYEDKEGNETYVYDETQKIGNRQPAGSPLPKFFGGLSNMFTYKNFDLSFQFVFSYGGKIYDDAAKRYLGVITTGNDAWNYRRDIIDHWTPENTDAPLPKLTTTIKNWGNATGTQWNNNSTLWLYDASYIRLRNVTLGYNLNPKGKIGPVQNLRIAAIANNALLFTNLYGLDPETARFVDNAQRRNIGGVGNSYLNTPQEKSFMLNVSFDF